MALFKNATALITGGSQGLGKGFAKTFLELGGRVSVLDVSNDNGLDTVNEFNAEFGTGSALFIKCDVRKKTEIEGAFKKTKDIYGSLDFVVNNAGVITMDDWERTIDINLTAVLRSCFIAAKYMSTSKGGRGGQIINIASTAGLTAVPFDPAYAASKHGVVGLSRSLAMMWRREGIQVKCLCPAFADTNIVKQGYQVADRVARSKFSKTIESVGLMKIDDVVKAFKALLEEENGNGAVMYVTVNGFGYKYAGKPRL